MRGKRLYLLFFVTTCLLYSRAVNAADCADAVKPSNQIAGCEWKESVDSNKCKIFTIKCESDAKIDRGCLLDSDNGPCFAHITRYFYNPKTGKCSPFVFGGCSANANNFNSMEECTSVCIEGQPRKTPSISLAVNKGSETLNCTRVNEQYYGCGACDSNCNSTKKAVCSLICRAPECGCIDGYVRNSNNVCVAPDKCKDPVKAFNLDPNAGSDDSARSSQTTQRPVSTSTGRSSSVASNSTSTQRGSSVASTTRGASSLTFTIGQAGSLMVITGQASSGSSTTGRVNSGSSTTARLMSTSSNSTSTQRPISTSQRVNSGSSQTTQRSISTSQRVNSGSSQTTQRSISTSQRVSSSSNFTSTQRPTSTSQRVSSSSNFTSTQRPTTTSQRVNAGSSTSTQRSMNSSTRAPTTISKSSTRKMTSIPSRLTTKLAALLTRRFSTTKRRTFTLHPATLSTKSRSASKRKQNLCELIKCPTGYRCDKGNCVPPFGSRCDKFKMAVTPVGCNYAFRIKSDGCAIPSLVCNNITCGKNEEAKLCGACDGTCGSPVCIPAEECRRASCGCFSGYVRNKSNNCVPKSECNSTTTSSAKQTTISTNKASFDLN